MWTLSTNLAREGHAIRPYELSGIVLFTPFHRESRVINGYFCNVAIWRGRKIATAD
jgi:hypothetical protein